MGVYTDTNNESGPYRYSNYNTDLYKHTHRHTYTYQYANRYYGSW
jgi:hypothetical protein